MPDTPLAASDRYAIAHAHLALLFDYGKWMLNSQAGRDAEERELWTDRILSKLVINAITLHSIAPNPVPAAGELWDVPSMYALARALIETHDAFAYICIQSASDEVSAFRLQIWKQHADEQRLRLATLREQGESEVEQLKELADRGRAALVTHPLFETLYKSDKEKIKKRNAPMYVLPVRERNEAAGIDPERYQAAMTELSSYLHSHPSALHRLWSFMAASDEAMEMAAVALEYAASFLARSIVMARPLFAVLVPQASNETEEVLDHWAGWMEPRQEKAPRSPSGLLKVY